MSGLITDQGPLTWVVGGFRWVNPAAFAYKGTGTVAVRSASAWLSVPEYGFFSI